MGISATLRFDIAESEAEKIRGQELAVSNRSELLAEARSIAACLARRHKDRECTADDVYYELAQLGLPTDLGNAAGSLFKGSQWVFTGKRIKSLRVSNHARWIMVWRLL
jgi:hypothetical protein